MTTATNSNPGTRRSGSHAIAIILAAALVAGTLDATGAIVVYGPLLGKSTVPQIFRFIASAVFGKEAFTGGQEMALYGLLFHYLIALSFTIFYFIIFPYISLLRQQKVAAGLIYGVVVWSVMNLVVLPLAGLSSLKNFHFIPALKGLALIMFLIGLPIALIIPRYYARK